MVHFSSHFLLLYKSYRRTFEHSLLQVVECHFTTYVRWVGVNNGGVKSWMGLIEVIGRGTNINRYKKQLIGWQRKAKVLQSIRQIVDGSNNQQGSVALNDDKVSKGRL